MACLPAIFKCQRSYCEIGETTQAEVIWRHVLVARRAQPPLVTNFVASRVDGALGCASRESEAEIPVKWRSIHGTGIPHSAGRDSRQPARNLREQRRDEPADTFRT